MSKVSTTQSTILSEAYTVKFWYENNDGYHTKTEIVLYSNSRAAHKQVEKFATKAFGSKYKNFSIINVTYQ